MSKGISGHKPIEQRGFYCLYTVYDNRTDFPIAVDSTAKECARIMGKTIGNFYCLVNRALNGKVKRWTVMRRFVDEGDEEDV